MMQQEVSSGYEDCDSEDISGHVIANDMLKSTVIHCAKQVFDRGKFNPSCGILSHSQANIFDGSDFEKSILQGKAISNDAEFHIKLLKNESEELLKQIKLFSTFSDQKTVSPKDQIHLSIYKNLATAIKGNLHKLDELLCQVETCQDGKDVRLGKLLTVFSNLTITKNLMQSKFSHKELMDWEIRNMEQNVVDVRKTEIAKRNEMEAEYMAKIAKLELANSAFEETVAQQSKQIKEQQESLNQAKISLETLRCFEKNNPDLIIEQTIKEKIIAENRVWELQSKLEISEAEYEGQVRYLQRELSEQIEERQKNDYKTIFLEDQVAVLLSKNAKLKEQLNFQSKEPQKNSFHSAFEHCNSKNVRKMDFLNCSQESEKFSKDAKMMNSSQEIFKTVLDNLDEINVDEADGSLRKSCTESFTNVQVSQCSHCSDMDAKFSRLELSLNENEESKLELEKRITNLLQEKVEMSSRLCEAGRMNTALKEDLKNMENVVKQKHDAEMNAAEEKYANLHEEFVKSKEELVKIQMDLSFAKERADEAIRRSESFERDNQILKEQLTTISQQLSSVMESQMMVNEEQSSLINQMQQYSSSKNAAGEILPVEKQVAIKEIGAKEALQVDEKKKLVREHELQETLSKLNFEKMEVEILNKLLKNQVKTLEEKIIKQKLKFSSYQQKKRNCLDDLIHKNALKRRELQQSMLQLKSKNELTNSSNSELTEQLKIANEKLRSEIQKNFASESYKLQLESSLKQNCTQLHAKSSEHDTLQKKYDTLNERFDNLKLEITDLKIQNAKLDALERNLLPDSAILSNRMQDKIEALCNLSFHQIKAQDCCQNSSKHANNSFTGIMELEHLRSENARLNYNLKSCLALPLTRTKAEDVEKLINQSHRRALSILSISGTIENQFDAPLPVGPPLHCSSPIKANDNNE